MSSIRIGYSRALPYFLILPAVLVVLGVLGYCVAYGIGLSFFRVQIGEPGRPFVGFANYVNIFQDPRFLNSLRISFLFVLGSVSAAFVFAMGFALTLYRVKRFSNGFKGLTLIPYLVSPVAAATIFRFLYSGDAGFINLLLATLGQEPILFLSSTDWTLIATIVANVWFNVPFAVLILLAGLESVDTQLFDAARVDGAGRSRIFFSIIVPSIYPMIGITLTWLTFVSFNIFALVLALTGGGPKRVTEVLPLLMYNIGFKDLNYSLGSVIMVVILSFNVTASVVFLKVFKERY
jgi:multiple sugar transport system permease protein